MAAVQVTAWWRTAALPRLWEQAFQDRGPPHAGAGSVRRPGPDGGAEVQEIVYSRALGEGARPHTMLGMTSDPPSPSSQRDPSSQPSLPSQSSQPSPTDLSDSGASGSGADADRLAAASPTTPAADLARIAAARPDLHPDLAANPATYPDLIDWLRTSPDPAVQTVLAQRTTAQPAPPPAAGAPVPTAPLPGSQATGCPAPVPPQSALAAPAPSPAPSSPRRRVSRPVMITVVVLVVGLVLGAATVVGLRLLLRKDSATGPAIPSNDWARGARIVWTLDTDDGPDSRVTIAGDNDQLIVASFINHNLDSPERLEIEVTRVTAYDVSGDEPEEQWSTDPDMRQAYHSYPNPLYYGPFYWGDYIVVGDKLLRADNGEVSDAPWDTSPTLMGNYAIDCDEKDHCSGWSVENLNQKLWEADIPDGFEYLYSIGDEYESFRGVYEGDRTIAFVSPSIAVDAATGELYDFHIDYRKTGYVDVPFFEDDSVFVLADGWSKYNLRSNQVTILSPTGEEMETLDVGMRDDVGVYLTSDHPRPTAAELKSYIQNGDAGWAQIRGEYNSDANTGCSTTLTIGDSTFKPTDESGNCSTEPPYPHAGLAFSLSPDGSVLISLRNNSVTTSTGRWISGAWNVKDGRVIKFPGGEFADFHTSFYMVNSELIVAYDDNELTAYRPDEK